jgi:hypothetical protein
MVMFYQEFCFYHGTKRKVGTSEQVGPISISNSKKGEVEG